MLGEDGLGTTHRLPWDDMEGDLHLVQKCVLPLQALAHPVSDTQSDTVMHSRCHVVRFGIYNYCSFAGSCCTESASTLAVEYIFTALKLTAIAVPKNYNKNYNS